MATGSEPRSKRALLRWLIFFGVVATGLAVASAVFAGWTTISMANSAIDTAAWGATPTYTDPTGDATPANTRDDMTKAWFKYDGTNIYFRITTAGTTALSSSNRRAVGMIDCNHDGDFTDPFTAQDTTAGDRLVIYNPGPTGQGVYIRDGAFQQITGALSGDNFDAVTTDIEWQVPLIFLPPQCRASLDYVNISWAIGDGTTGATVDGASQYFALSNPMDFGDTSNPTPVSGNCATPAAGNPQTILQCNGARNGIVPMTPGVPLRFGSEAVDADPGNLHNAASDADDTNGTTPDDEQGIAPDATNSWSDGSGTLLFTIVGAANARVGCWIDFNKNGAWTDAGETVIDNATINSATTSRSVTIPGGLTWPNSFPARCRVWQNPGANTPTPVPAPNGPIEFGEVEDHIWAFDASGNFVAPGAPSAVTNLVIANSGTVDVKLTWTNPAPNDGAHVLAHATNPYFTSATGTFAVDQLVNAAPWEYTHAGVRGAPADTFYYLVYGRLGATEAATPSNRVGLFEFSLTPGL